MSEEASKQLVIDGFIANSRVTYTQSVMTIEHLIDITAYVALIILALLLLVFSSLFGNQVCFFIGLIVSILIILFGVIPQRSYRYEFDKEQGEITLKWGGFLGTSVGKAEIPYSLDEVAHIKVHQVTNYRGRDSFKVKIVFQDNYEVELPSEHSFGSCMEYANLYKDFLELKTPIKMTSTFF